MEQPREKKNTYADYLTWDDGNRYELIDGVAYMLAAPSSIHQEIVANLTAELVFCLKGKPCKVFPSPYDVRLNADTKDDTVVQPDISVICDPGKIEARGCKGAPDMVIEILSPSTALYDYNSKLSKYLEAGVREYWIVSPDERRVQVYLFENGKGILQIYKDAEVIPVHALGDCRINLAEVFPPRPDKEA